MRCMPCGTEMRFVGVAPYQAMVRTRELHTFECPNCRRTEQRLVFAHSIGSFPSVRNAACLDNITVGHTCDVQNRSCISERLDVHDPDVSP
jgi:hypothetical protein